MTNSNKALDVFEFKDDDELTETAAKRFATKFISGGTQILSKAFANVICGGASAANIHYNHTAAGSFTHSETESDEHKSKSNHFLHVNFGGHEQCRDMKSNSGSAPLGLEYCSTPGASACLEDNSNCVFPELSCNDESVRLDSNADDSMSEESSSATRADNDSSDGPSSDNYFSGLDTDDDRGAIIFYPDYIDYCGAHYLDSTVTFSRSSVEVKGNTVYGNEGTFHVLLDINDIVKIESQWSARFETSTVNICFISEDATQDSVVHNASGIQKLRFPATDSNWHKKQEAIEHLNVRYKALWDLLLDTAMENFSSLPDRKSFKVPRSYFPNIDMTFDEVYYPKGDPDAVAISRRDIDLLQPDTYLNDTIIDVYIKYLKSKIDVNKSGKFHFFNSFFFRKLADMDKDPSSALDAKAAFLRVHKWTRKINFLEKDFMFIPVNYNYHWSLIVICYFGEAASNKDVEADESVRVPCVLHMDSIKGSHAGLKDLMQNYLWEEWKERKKDTCEELYSKFRNLKFVSLELPQQQNSYDCGIFLLHYVELFLEEVPLDFNINKLSKSSNFLQADWFPPSEASLKRVRIEWVIKDIFDTYSKDCSSPYDGTGMHGNPDCPETTHDYENGVELYQKSSSLRNCEGSSLCSEVGQCIEMTVLPASSTRNTQSARSSALVLKELMESGSASESFEDAPWRDFEHSVSLNEVKGPVSILEGDVEAGKSFVRVDLAEPVYQHPVGTPIDTVPCSSGQFGTSLINQGSPPLASGSYFYDATEAEADEECQSIHEVGVDLELDKSKYLSEFTESLTVSFEPVSGDLHNAAESCGLVDVPGQDMSNTPEFVQGADHLQANPAASDDYLSNDPEFVSHEKFDVSEVEIPHQEVISNNHAIPHQEVISNNHAIPHQEVISNNHAMPHQEVISNNHAIPLPVSTEAALGLSHNQSDEVHAAVVNSEPESDLQKLHPLKRLRMTPRGN